MTSRRAEANSDTLSGRSSCKCQYHAQKLRPSRSKAALSEEASVRKFAG